MLWFMLHCNIVHLTLLLGRVKSRNEENRPANADHQEIREPPSLQCFNQPIHQSGRSGTTSALPDGYELRVVDASTGEDLTRLILAQIVVEDAKTPDSVFPLDVLRQMILASGRATQENALRYMKAVTDMYQNAYRALPTPINPFEFLPGRSPQPPSADRATGNPQSEAAKPLATSAPQANASDVAELKRRIEELELLLTKRAPKKARESQSLAANLDALRQNTYCSTHNLGWLRTSQL